MALKLTHFTLSDPTLTHQVVIFFSGSHIFISCNCRKIKKNNISHHPIGPTSDLKESRELYNNPKNHWKPFSKEDEAVW